MQNSAIALRFCGLVLVTLWALDATSQVDDGQNVRIVEGPILLHANLDQQWGGHTFAYLLEGESGLFWSATMYNPDGNTWGSLIGKFPKRSAGERLAVTPIPISGPDVKSMTQPLMLRSDDGYIHVFIGSSRHGNDPNYTPGEIRYFRSVAPEDITQFVDRTELIPRVAPYNEFHLRMNVGVSKDGKRAALVILAISKDGGIPFNTPVIFFGDKRGPDYIFREPVNYAEPMGFFYPQIALTDSGAIVVGQVWDDPARSTARLLHLDANGKEVHRKDLPAAASGNHWCLDLRPATPDDWSEFVLYYNQYAKDEAKFRHEFWTYAPATAKLVKGRSVAVEESAINYGKWMPVSESRSVFLHNPSMGGFEAYDGDLLGVGEFSTVSLPATDPATLGYAGSAYTFVPNPLQGSVTTPGTQWFATDTIGHKNDPGERIRAAMLLYRLAFGP